MKNRLLRQNFLGENSYKIFSSSKIVIIGLCGGGSHIAQQLAHMGFENFYIVDFDIVDETNLNRMIGSTPIDAAKAEYKAVVIERLIKSINKEAKVHKVIGKWEENSDLFKDSTVIVGCVDKYVVRYELERFCRRFLIPYIDIGMDVHKEINGYSISGQVVTSLPGSVCMKCLGIITEDRLSEESKKYGDAGSNPQVVWSNGALASIAVGQLIKLLSPWSTPNYIAALIEYDGNRQSVSNSSKLPIVEKRGCIHYSNLGLGDPFYSMK